MDISVQQGNYTLNGTLHAFSGSTISVPDNGTNVAYFTTQGLRVGNAYPTDSSYIPLAEITASGGSVASVSDQRSFQSDNREHFVAQVLHAGYPDAVLQADGTNNVGQMSLGTDDVSGQNYYQWVSSKATLQDYDVVLRFAIPSGFTSWSAPALRLTYQTDSDDPGENAIDLIVKDEAGNDLTLTAPSTSMINTNWTTGQWSFSGSPDWKNMHAMVVRIRLHSKNLQNVRIGDLSLRYNELQ